MREYRIAADKLGRRSRRRIGWMLLVLATLVILALSGALKFAPSWVISLSIAVAAAILLAEFALFRRAKHIGETFCVRLLSDGLDFSYAGASGHLPYKDLHVTKRVMKKGNVAEIHLRTVFGQTVKLMDFDDMSGLHDAIVSHIESAKNSPQ